MKVNGKDDIPYMKWKKNVPNHQPVNIAMENGWFIVGLPFLKLVIVQSYVYQRVDREMNWYNVSKTIINHP